MKLSSYCNYIKRFNKNASRLVFAENRLGAAQYIRIWASEIYCFCRFGCSPDDYFRYEFYKKSNYERAKFITYRKSQFLIKKYNAPKYREVLQDKVSFNKFFDDYIKRDWISLKDATQEDFAQFIKKHGEILVKPLKGGQGIGIHKVSVDDVAKVKIQEYRDFIAEEILSQHTAMKTLNPSSVNTVRVLTFDGEPIAAAIRIGVGSSIVDNLHSEGICGHIDLNTGIIDAKCINNRYEKFILHPTTGEKLVGFKIPYWAKVLETVRNAASKLPQEKYIGWDVAVLEQDVALIEGNHDPGHDVVQMIAQTGLWKVIKNKMR